jgi:hypothetical protein
MLHGFSDQGHLGHERKGLHKVGKDQVAVQFSSHQLPIGQGGSEGGKVDGVKELGRHGESQQVKGRRDQSTTVKGKVMEPVNE